MAEILLFFNIYVIDAFCLDCTCRIQSLFYLETRHRGPVIILLVSTWRRGSHVGCQEQNHFCPLGTKLYFLVNSLNWQFALCWSPDFLLCEFDLPVVFWVCGCPVLALRSFHGFFSYSSNDVNAEILKAYTGSTDTLPALVMVIHEKVGNKGVFTPIYNTLACCNQL